MESAELSNGARVHARIEKLTDDELNDGLGEVSAHIDAAVHELRGTA